MPEIVSKADIFFLFSRMDSKKAVFAGKKGGKALDVVTIVLILLTVPIAIESVLEICDRRKKEA